MGNRYCNLILIFLLVMATESIQTKDNDNETLALKSLITDLSAFTRKTERELHVFHYQSSFTIRVDESKPYEENQKIAIKHAQKWQNMAHETGSYISNLLNMVGPGLYAAPDSNVSKSYAKSRLFDSVMLKIKIPKDSQLLDLRIHDSAYHFPISSDTRKAMANLCSKFQASSKFPKYSLDGNTYYLIDRDIFSKNKKCFNILKQALDILNITLIAYTWYDPLIPSECDNPSPHSTAFLLYSTPLNEKTVDVYTEKVPENATREQIKDYWAMDDVRQRYEYPRLPPNTKASSEAASYIQETHFGCSKRYAKQDNFQHNPKNNFNTSLEDVLKINQKLNNCYSVKE